MTIAEYTKSQIKKVMAQPKEERLAYFWDYFKWHAIIFILVIALLIQGVLSIVNRKETVFTGFLLNCSVIDQDQTFLQGFYEYAGIDSKQQEAAFYTGLALRENNAQVNANVFQRIVAGIAIDDADFIIGQPDHFRPCAYHTSKILVDLREFLDAETLEKVSDRLYYIDGAVLQQLTAPLGEMVHPESVKYPDPTKPDTMADPIPIGIDISDRTQLRDTYYYFPDTTLYIGVISSARPEITRQFIDYLFS